MPRPTAASRKSWASTPGSCSRSRGRLCAACSPRRRSGTRASSRASPTSGLQLLILLLFAIRFCKQQEGSTTRLGMMDPIVEHLQRKGMPVTLENWLTFAFSDEPPDNWWMEIEVPAELEDELELYISNNPTVTEPPTEDAQREQAPEASSASPLR